MLTPNTVLTDNLNGTFITYNGNELSLQNDAGNRAVTYLSENFYPIGTVEHGGIIYIVSVKNPGKVGYAFEVGSFPSLPPDSVTYEKLNNQSIEQPLDFEYEYRPFFNLIKDSNTVTEFRTSKIEGYDLEHPVTIEVQPSYDGSVNLILNDGKNNPLLINSGFAVLGNGKGKFVKRNQGVKTNYYDEDNVQYLTKLINTSHTFTTVDLGTVYDDFTVASIQDIASPYRRDGVQSGGQLKGGNYTFYFKFGDDDGNQTDIICESGIVSVFNGTPGVPNTISGAFNNEQTDKLVKLTLNNIDTSYSRIYVYYTREYCDLNGYRLVETKALTTPFKIKDSKETIIISGVEETQDISVEDLNIYYHTVSSAKTSSQQQNMLFLGNITSKEVDAETLQNYSYEIEVGIQQSEDIGSVRSNSYDASLGAEYYDPHNIYYKLGYWPNEIYRFGVVFIKSDGSTTQAFNLKGCNFSKVGDTNRKSPHKTDYSKSEDGIFIDETTTLDNLRGVFKTPNVDIIGTDLVKPLYFTFKISNLLITKLAKLGVVGYFIVRQKRIPITVCQGYSIGIDSSSYIPMLRAYKTPGDPNHRPVFITESFISSIENNFNVDSSDLDRLFSLLGPLTDNVVAPLSYESSLLLYDPSMDNPTNTRIIIEESSLSAYIYVHQRFLTGYGTYWCAEIIAPKKEGATIEYDHVWYTSHLNTIKNNVIQECKEEYNNKYKSKIFEGGKNYRDLVNSGITYNNNDHNTQFKRIIDIIGSTCTKRRTVESSQNASLGLISVESMLNPQIQSMLNGSNFELETAYICYPPEENWPSFVAHDYRFTDNSANLYNTYDSRLIYIPENTALKYINGIGFSTKVGDGTNVQEFGFLGKSPDWNDENNNKLVRGHYTPYIGAILNLEDTSSYCNILYNIRIPHSDSYKNEFIIRANSQSDFFAVTDKTYTYNTLDVYRGDCFTNTVTVRMNRNFIDQNAPISEKIVDPLSWHKYYHGYYNVPSASNDSDQTANSDINSFTQWDKINIGDLNTVSLGHWFTYKCLANSNLGLRSVDTFHPDEMALMGNPRAFYPLYGMSTSTGMKLEESHLLNDGYNATVGRRRNTLKQDTPYDKNEFSTRIIFSNVSETDAFTNGYRVFQGLSYKDYPKQYGDIVKLLPWGNNLFCVFEHGLAIIPVNEKALMQTTTEQTIHIYGHGVLPDQMSIVSQDFGSYWADSVIRTPIGIYGVDTSAKKIWRYSDQKGFETISDMKIQRFLNDNINLDLTTRENLGETNVKTHYNNHKGDVMFTFYNTNDNFIRTKEDRGKREWNICYNERQGLWVTRYSWTPLMSENIDNSFYSIENKSYGKVLRLPIYEHYIIGNNKNGRSMAVPCNWYNKQHPFEFEFVVNDPSGIHKIFEDLTIISNNVQPESIEFELVGDDYLFNRARIYHLRLYNEESGLLENIYGDNVDPTEYMPYSLDLGFTKSDYYLDNYKNIFKNARVAYDKVLDEYTLIINQPCKNKDVYGVRLGNIQYKEDSWYTNIEPLRYNEKLNDPKYRSFYQDPTNPDSAPTDENFKSTDKFASTKLRDKWIKIRIKYPGDQLAIVNGVITSQNISYA